MARADYQCELHLVIPTHSHFIPLMEIRLDIKKEGGEWGGGGGENTHTHKNERMVKYVLL